MSYECKHHLNVIRLDKWMITRYSFDLAIHKAISKLSE
jgi:hypothetical protein